MPTTAPVPDDAKDEFFDKDPDIQIRFRCLLVHHDVAQSKSIDPDAILRQIVDTTQPADASPNERASLLGPAKLAVTNSVVARLVDEGVLQVLYSTTERAMFDQTTPIQFSVPDPRTETKGVSTLWSTPKPNKIFHGKCGLTVRLEDNGNYKIQSRISMWRILRDDRSGVNTYLEESVGPNSTWVIGDFGSLFDIHSTGTLQPNIIVLITVQKPNEVFTHGGVI